MKTLNPNFLGGFRIRSNDWIFVQSGISEAIAAPLKSFSEDIFILSGCERSVTGGTVTISAGYVSYNGEVCEVPAHTYAEPVGAEVEHWEKYVVYDPAGTKVFQNLTTHETYEVYRARVVKASSLPGGAQEYSDTLTYHQLITDSIVRDTWHIFDTQTVPPSGFFPGTYNLSYYKDIDGFIHLKGQQYFEDLSGAIDEAFATLPVGARPPSTVWFTVCGIKNTSTGEIGVNMGTIGTDGVMKMKTMDMGAACLLDYGQIPPFQAV